MKYIAFIFIFVALFLCSCNNIKVNDTQSTDLQTEDTLRTITEEMAYEGVNNYCHKEYDWSVAKDNPDIMFGFCVSSGIPQLYWGIREFLCQ